MDLEKVHAVLD
jgi:hypothetical protein